MKTQINLQDVYDVYATLKADYEARTMLLTSIKKIGLEEEFANFLKANPVSDTALNAIDKKWFQIIVTYADGLATTSYQQAENTSMAILLGIFWAFDDVKDIQVEEFNEEFM